MKRYKAKARVFVRRGGFAKTVTEPGDPQMSLMQIQEAIEQLPIVNTHTHMGTREHPGGRIPGREPGTPFDLADFILSTYAGRDLLSSGLSFDSLNRESFDPEHDPDAGWNRIAPYIGNIRGTTYYRSLIWAFQTMYDFDDDELDDSNWRALSEQISANACKPDWGDRIAREFCGYSVGLHGTGDARLSPEYFAEVLPISQFIFGCSLTEEETRGKIERETLTFDQRMCVAVCPKGFTPAEDVRSGYNEQYGEPESVQDVLDAMDKSFEEFKTRGAVATKIQTAYYRRIYFSDIPREEAERIFNMPEEKRSLVDITHYQDYMIHESIARAGEYNLAVQIHTGLQDGPGNYIHNSNPIHLANLFFEYPHVNFDIFHGGYPYCGELGTLAKNFANVYLNTCWMPLITLTGSKRFLREWIETVPGNKILWGDDCHHVESCVAGAIVGKKVVAETISEMVDDGYFSLNTGLDLARRILRQNALELYEFQREY